MANFSFIDLFAGIGGFRLALESVGGTCIGFSEIAPDAIKTYCSNFNEDPNSNFGDITKLKELPVHDFMTAGVPCQSWSIAGKNLGFDDDRGQLWNDTLFLLNKVRPKVFIFENVKGLADPRNAKALDYILNRIREAGYYARKYVLNAYDYGSPQTRVRIYIIGFKEEKYLEKLSIPEPHPGSVHLCDVLDDPDINEPDGKSDIKARWSLSCNEKGFNDYFLFNDLRNGDTTIHSWDIIETTPREKHICYLLLRNRRKKDYGKLDGNPLSLDHFKNLDSSIEKKELETLVKKRILKHVDYLYQVDVAGQRNDESDNLVLATAENGIINISSAKNNRNVKKHKINVQKTLQKLTAEGIIHCIERRYDFKNTKISTGLDGVNRIILPSCKIYPTLVASDTNDYITTIDVDGNSIEDFRKNFIEKVYRPGNFRKISKSEACRIQGFPTDFKLPMTRARWMKLIGNSVAVPVIKILVNAVVNTGVFDGQSRVVVKPKHKSYRQLNLFELFNQYEDSNIVNNVVNEYMAIPDSTQTEEMFPLDKTKNVLICNVKKDNEKQYLNHTASIYYTGQRFPSSITIKKMYYFMPYIKGKGIRDIYLIKAVRLGYRKEGQKEVDKKDLRLVFELQYLFQLYKYKKKINLDIWHTYRDLPINDLEHIV